MHVSGVFVVVFYKYFRENFLNFFVFNKWIICFSFFLVLKTCVKLLLLCHRSNYIRRASFNQLSFSSQSTFLKFSNFWIISFNLNFQIGFEAQSIICIGLYYALWMGPVGPGSLDLELFSLWKQIYQTSYVGLPRNLPGVGLLGAPEGLRVCRGYLAHNHTSHLHPTHKPLFSNYQH